MHFCSDAKVGHRIIAYSLCGPSREADRGARCLCDGPGHLHPGLALPVADTQGRTQSATGGGPSRLEKAGRSRICLSVNGKHLEVACGFGLDDSKSSDAEVGQDSDSGVDRPSTYDIGSFISYPQQQRQGGHVLTSPSEFNCSMIVQHVISMPWNTFPYIRPSTCPFNRRTGINYFTL